MKYEKKYDRKMVGDLYDFKEIREEIFREGIA